MNDVQRHLSIRLLFVKEFVTRTTIGFVVSVSLSQGGHLQIAAKGRRNKEELAPYNELLDYFSDIHLTAYLFMHIYTFFLLQVNINI